MSLLIDSFNKKIMVEASFWCLVLHVVLFRSKYYFFVTKITFGIKKKNKQSKIENKRKNKESKINISFLNRKKIEKVKERKR